MVRIFLTKAEIDALEEFADENLAVGVVEIMQDYKSGIRYSTYVQVRDIPKTCTNITDIDSW